MTESFVRGKTIRWTFSDGPMANRTFEHQFSEAGSVSWCMIDGEQRGKTSSEHAYEFAAIGDDVHAVSYLGASGYTLTVVLDARSGELVAFASNESQLTMQHGSFEVLGEPALHMRPDQPSARSQPRH